MNDPNSTQQIKKYSFYTNSQNSNSKEELEILIPEVSIQHTVNTSRVIGVMHFVAYKNRLLHAHHLV